MHLQKQQKQMFSSASSKRVPRRELCPAQWRSWQMKPLTVSIWFYLPAQCHFIVQLTEFLLCVLRETKLSSSLAENVKFGWFIGAVPYFIFMHLQLQPGWCVLSVWNQYGKVRGKAFVKNCFWRIQRLNNRYIPDLSSLLFYFFGEGRGGQGGDFSAALNLLFIALTSIFAIDLWIISGSDTLHLSFKLVVEAVVEVYTVEQLKEKALQSDEKLEPVHGIIYGYISTLDIDENVSRVLRNRWWATACLECAKNCLSLFPRHKCHGEIF